MKTNKFSRRPRLESYQSGHSTPSYNARHNSNDDSTFLSAHAQAVLARLLPMERRLKMVQDCCAGVAYLHASGFIHCDVKSLNFLGETPHFLQFVDEKFFSDSCFVSLFFFLISLMIVIFLITPQLQKILSSSLLILVKHDPS